MEGWMAAVNAIGLPKDSSFRNTDRVPLPEDPAIEAQAEEQGEGNSDEEEAVESPESCLDRLTPMWWCLMMTNRELEPLCPIRLPNQWSSLTLRPTTLQPTKEPSP